MCHYYYARIYSLPCFLEFTELDQMLKGRPKGGLGGGSVKKPSAHFKKLHLQLGYIGTPSGWYSSDPVSCDELVSYLKHLLDYLIHGRNSTNVYFFLCMMGSATDFAFSEDFSSILLLVYFQVLMPSVMSSFHFFFDGEWWKHLLGNSSFSCCKFQKYCSGITRADTLMGMKLRKQE